jgi:RNA polymerase sigma-70 factor, ECF subfamily
MHSKDLVTEAWSTNHAYLTNLAFGILGDLATAEDAVQEAFARLVATGIDQVEDARGWLIVVTSRICFDKVRSAPRRRERSHDDHALELVGDLARSPRGDPLDRITLDDEVRLALLVVLQRLSPAERVVFVLHDIFQMPFESIAEAVGRPTPSCRQLARRARIKLNADDRVGRFDVVSAEHQRITEQFIDACSGGDVTALVQLLDPAIAGDVDLGPLDPRSGTINYGADVVSTNFLRYFGMSTLVSVPSYGRPVILAFLNGRLRGIISLQINETRVTTIHVLADPAKMSLLREQLTVTGEVTTTVTFRASGG